jgi:F1F0 ATPase subunit 2
LLVGVEMDEKRMNLLSHGIWPVFAPPIVLTAHVAAGVAVGALFFHALWWNTRIIVGGGAVSTAIALTLTRFILLGGLLTLAAFEGAAPLVASSLGVFVGRFLVLRSIGKAER